MMYTCVKSLILVCTSPFVDQFSLILIINHSSNNSFVYIIHLNWSVPLPTSLSLSVCLPVFVSKPGYLFMPFQPTVRKSFSQVIDSFKGGVTFLSPYWSSVSNVRSVVRLQQAFLLQRRAFRDS